MSLDIWLVAMVNTGNPDRTEVLLDDLDTGCSSMNYTHNVTPMWVKAGCYDALYNSDGMVAKDTLPAINEAIGKMVTNPREYEALNPSNGWGEYISAVKFLLDWQEKLLRDPEAIIRVSK
mgnify:CR=1 FL=1